MPRGTEPTPGVWARTTAQVIEDLRLSSGAPRATLAQRSQVGEARISRCVLGRQAFTLDEVARLAAALGVTPTMIVLRAQRLLTGADESEQAPSSGA